MQAGAIRPPAQKQATLYSKSSWATSKLAASGRGWTRIMGVPAVIGIAIVMAGCVPSLQPLYTPEDLVFDPALVGTWTGPGGSDSWSFQKSDENAYRLTIAGTEEPDRFDVRLVRLGDRLFLDIYPVESLDMGGSFYRGHLILTHSFARISLDQDTLQVASLDHTWLWGMISDKKLKISHELVNVNEVVLTAPTKDLQAFVKKYAGNKEAFHAVEFHRQK